MNKGGNYVGMRRREWEGESKGREREDYTGIGGETGGGQGGLKPPTFEGEGGRAPPLLRL